MKVYTSAAVLLAGLWLAPGLAQTQPSHKNPDIKVHQVLSKNRVQLTLKKRFKVIYTPLPDPIPLNKHFRLKVQVQTPQNKIIPDAKITLKATMPAHNHGMNVKPKIKQLKDKVFEVKGLLFHMPGEWQIEVDVNHKGLKDKAVFRVQLGMPKVNPHHQH